MDSELNFKMFLKGNTAEYFHYLEVDKYFLNSMPKVTNYNTKKCNLIILNKKIC